MRKLFITSISLMLLLPGILYAQEQVIGEINTENGYSMQEAIDGVIKNNPELVTLKLELDAAEARLKQEGLWDNPTFTAESENFSGDNPGFNRTENTFWLSQPFLLGGKEALEKELPGRKVR